MSLYKIKDFDPDYRNHFDNQDFLSFDLYSGNEKVGSVDNLLVDENGNFRYLVINTGIWVFGKKVLLPIGRARISYPDHRIYADNLNRSQVESLPEFDEHSTVDFDHEERVRGTYRSGAATGVAGAATGVAGAAAVDQAAVDRTAAIGNTPLDRTAKIDRSAQGIAADRDAYSYDRDPELYNINERDHQNVKLYEERLIASKKRQKTGEVAINKRVETETAKVTVPIEKERIVVERTPGAVGNAPVDVGSANFQAGEVARIEVYEEVPDIRKETIVRENVSVRKEIDRDTVNAEEQLRREELDVDTQGRPSVDHRPNQQPNQPHR